jgi:hypothetical protein
VKNYLLAVFVRVAAGGNKKGKKLARAVPKLLQIPISHPIACVKQQIHPFMLASEQEYRHVKTS